MASTKGESMTKVTVARPSRAAVLTAMLLAFLLFQNFLVHEVKAKPGRTVTARGGYADRTGPAIRGGLSKGLREVIDRAPARRVPTALRKAMLQETFTLRECAIGPKAGPDGYQFMIFAASTREGDFIIFDFLKQFETGALQDHSWFFELNKDSVNVPRDLSKCTIDTGRQMGAFGKVDGVLRNPGNARSTGDACFSQKTRKAGFNGTARLVTDMAPFGTMRFDSSKGSISRFKSVFSEECMGGGQPPCFYGLYMGLSGPTETGGFWFMDASKEDGSNEVLETFFRSEQFGNAFYGAFVFAPGPGGNLVLGQDQMSATVTGNAPLFGGTANYTPDAPPEVTQSECGSDSFSYGQTSGPLSVMLDTGAFQAVSGPENPAFFVNAQP